jgi:hypothetical protein
MGRAFFEFEIIIVLREDKVEQHPALIEGFLVLPAAMSKI